MPTKYFTPTLDKEPKKTPIPCQKVSTFLPVPDGIRTHGLPLRRRTLYPAELRRQITSIILYAVLSKVNTALMSQIYITE